MSFTNVFVIGIILVVVVLVVIVTVPQRWRVLQQGDEWRCKLSKYCHFLI